MGNKLRDPEGSTGQIRQAGAGLGGCAVWVPPRYGLVEQGSHGELPLQMFGWAVVGWMVGEQGEPCVRPYRGWVDIPGVGGVGGVGGLGGIPTGQA